MAEGECTTTGKELWVSLNSIFALFILVELIAYLKPTISGVDVPDIMHIVLCSVILTTTYGLDPIVDTLAPTGIFLATKGSISKYLPFFFLRQFDLLIFHNFSITLR